MNSCTLIVIITFLGLLGVFTSFLLAAITAFL